MDHSEIVAPELMRKNGETCAERAARIQGWIAGSSRPPPNVVPATLTFEWRRDVPTLYLVAENDSALPMDGMRGLSDRTRSAKCMEILAGADHGHFFDKLEWQPGQCSKEEAHRVARGLTLAHLDTTLRALPGAAKFWQERVRN